MSTIHPSRIDSPGVFLGGRASSHGSSHHCRLALATAGHSHSRGRRCVSRSSRLGTQHRLDAPQVFDTGW